MKILIVKTSALGDIIHALPVVGYLRAKFPEAQIHWAAEEAGAELLRAHPDIDQVITYDTKRWRRGIFAAKTRQAMRDFLKELRSHSYDVVFDLQGNLKSALVTKCAKAPKKVGFGLKTVAEWPNLLVTNHRLNPPEGRNVREDYLYLPQTFFGDEAAAFHSEITFKLQDSEIEKVDDVLRDPLFKTDSEKVLVCPGSLWRNKRLTPATLTALLKKLEEDYWRKGCVFLFAWGNSPEQQLCQELHRVFAANSLILDRLPLPTLQHLMSKVNLVIGMDSLPLHLAGTTATPTFSIFGPSSQDKFRPPGPQHRSMQGECPYRKTFDKRCPKLRSCPTGACVRGLTGNEVFKRMKAEG